MRMKRKIFLGFMAMAVSFVFLFPAIGLSQRELLGPQGCWLPYNVKIGDWNTGIHITAYLPPSEGESIFALFWDNNTGENYASVEVPLNAAGSWTGVVQSLLDTPSDYRNASLLIFQSTAGFFSVTQFIVNSGSGSPGFGHQTFYSEPVPVDIPQ